MHAQKPTNAGDGVCQLGDIAAECKGLDSGTPDFASICVSGCFQEMGDCESALLASGMNKTDLNTMVSLASLCAANVGNSGKTCADYFNDISNIGLTQDDSSAGWLAHCLDAPGQLSTFTCSQQCATSVIPTMAACGDAFTALFYSASTPQAGLDLDELAASCKLTVAGSPTDGSTAGDGICQQDDIEHLCGSIDAVLQDSNPNDMEQECALGCFQEMSDCRAQLIAAADGDQERIKGIEDAIGFTDLCESNNCASQMDGIDEQIQSSCGTTTNEEMPSTCPHDCAAVFLPFMKSCGNIIAAALGPTEADTVGKFYNFEILCENSALGGTK
eukprot:SAG11_NODE_2104_length_3818_cov_4.175316_4_plen_331_part_00